MWACSATVSPFGVHEIIIDLRSNVSSHTFVLCSGVICIESDFISEAFSWRGVPLNRDKKTIRTQISYMAGAAPPVATSQKSNR